MIVIRYADDIVLGFQHEREAQAFLHDLQERLRKFELALPSGCLGLGRHTTFYSGLPAGLAGGELFDHSLDNR